MSKTTKSKNAPLPPPLVEIADACGMVAVQRNAVQALLVEINDKQLEVTRQYAPRLRAAVGELALVRGVVHGLVLKARALFLEPKSRKFDGIAVGFEKGRDSVTMPDEAQLIKNIRALLPAKAELLIAPPVESVRAQALKDLSAAEKQLLGIRTTTGVDTAFVRLEKSDVEAQAAALLAAFEVQPVTSEVQS
jgi:hypothetical protein